MTNDPGFDVPLTPNEIEVFLGRPETDIPLSDLPPQKILVTGAGGSIGRALTISLLENGHTVTALDKNENGLFLLHQLCVENKKEILPEFLVLNLGAYIYITEHLRANAYDVVIHAAAHKHVGMMELNAVECRRNNLEHSLNLFQQAGKADVKRFVFLSTDKAVDPIGVMGKSKHEAERHLAHFAASSTMTLTTMRLPNVLGSDGSVTQIFRRQLGLGRPLSITNPEAARLFISPHQATQLIMTALHENHVGTRVPAHVERLTVLDLAKRAHSLWGLGAEVEMVATGLGAGERLEEKLVAPDEVESPSQNPSLTAVTKAG
ncbi:MAG: FlaA1/EpsC-like NDP-sugar epimerase [Planctomycetota bacterium]|jgi:FlaA1/EpsC-like NDP-sugar epimerase